MDFFIFTTVKDGIIQYLFKKIKKDPDFYKNLDL